MATIITISEIGMNPSPYTYVRDPQEIYRQSFAKVAEIMAGKPAFPPPLDAVAARLIHACGNGAVVDQLAFSAPDHLAPGINGLKKDAHVFCDVEMVRAGLAGTISSARLICTLPAAALSPESGVPITRSAAGVTAWPAHAGWAGWANSIVVIGNAPTALFALLEGLHAGWPPPALIIAMPIGFIGAAESKQALMDFPDPPPYIALQGTIGGAALAVAATLGCYRSKSVAFSHG